jgi:hypothetical protein
MLKPNFSGTWKFNPAKSVLQIPAPDATEFVIEHREPALRISRTHIVGEQRDTFSLDLTTDGQEVWVDHGDLRICCRAYWDGDMLVFDSKLIRAGEEATNFVRYALTDGGKTFRAEERFRSGSLNYDNLWILDRSEPN